MRQLDSGPDSAGRQLGPCWKAAVVAEEGPAERHGLTVDRKGLVQQWWSSSETKSRKLEKRACGSIGCSVKQDCWIEKRSRNVKSCVAKRHSLR